MLPVFRDDPTLRLCLYHWHQPPLCFTHSFVSWFITILIKNFKFEFIIPTYFYVIWHGSAFCLFPLLNNFLIIIFFSSAWIIIQACCFFLWPPLVQFPLNSWKWVKKQNWRTTAQGHFKRTTRIFCSLEPNCKDLCTVQHIQYTVPSTCVQTGTVHVCENSLFPTSGSKSLSPKNYTSPKCWVDTFFLLSFI